MMRDRGGQKRGVFNSLLVSRGVVSEKRLNAKQFTNRNIFLNNIYCKCKDSMTNEQKYDDS